MNYIYGTWSVLCALNAAGLEPGEPDDAKGGRLARLHPESRRRLGRGRRSYKLDYRGYEPAPSTASQTAWALIGLMAAGAIDSPAVKRGVDYLAAHARRGRVLGRRTLHGDRFPARVLFALPRLCEILPALGAGALPQHHAAALRQIWHVTPRDCRTERPRFGLHSSVLPVAEAPCPSSSLCRMFSAARANKAPGLAASGPAAARRWAAASKSDSGRAVQSQE